MQMTNGGLVNLAMASIHLEDSALILMIQMTRTMNEGKHWLLQFA